MMPKKVNLKSTKNQYQRLEKIALAFRECGDSHDRYRERKRQENKTQQATDSNNPGPSTCTSMPYSALTQSSSSSKPVGTNQVTNEQLLEEMKSNKRLLKRILDTNEKMLQEMQQMHATIKQFFPSPTK